MTILCFFLYLFIYYYFIFIFLPELGLIVKCPNLNEKIKVIRKNNNNIKKDKKIIKRHWGVSVTQAYITALRCYGTLLWFSSPTKRYLRKPLHLTKTPTTTKANGQKVLTFPSHFRPFPSEVLLAHVPSYHTTTTCKYI